MFLAELLECEPSMCVTTSCCCCCILQGVYRGLQDTKTPFYATVAANALNIVLGWTFIFGLQLGVRGAAMATVTAQVRLPPSLVVLVSNIIFDRIVFLHCLWCMAASVCWRFGAGFAVCQTNDSKVWRPSQAGRHCRTGNTDWGFATLLKTTGSGPGMVSALC